MPDPFGSNRKRAPYRPRAIRLAGVAYQMQAVVASVREHIAKPMRRAAHFVAANSVGNYAVIAPRHSELGDFHPFFRTKLADRVEYPECLNRGPLRFAPHRVVNCR